RLFLVNTTAVVHVSVMYPSNNELASVKSTEITGPSVVIGESVLCMLRRAAPAGKRVCVIISQKRLLYAGDSRCVVSIPAVSHHAPDPRMGPENSDLGMLQIRAPALYAAQVRKARIDKHRRKPARLKTAGYCTLGCGSPA